MAGTTPVTPFFEDNQVLTGNSTCLLRLTSLHLISLAPSVGNDILKFIFENVVSVNPLHSDGIQPRFSSLGPASPGPCSHH